MHTDEQRIVKGSRLAIPFICACTNAMSQGIKFETLKSGFKITLLFHQGTSIRGFASKCIVFNTKLATGPEMLPMQTSVCIFQSGNCSLCRPQRAHFSSEDVTYTDFSVHFFNPEKCSRCRRQCTFFNMKKCSRCRRKCAFFNPEKCSLCRPQRALFNPEDVTYTDVSVHFSVRKMFRMQISACTFQSGRCMGLGHEGLRVIRADIDHQPAS